MKFISNHIERRKLLNMKWALTAQINHLERAMMVLPVDLVNLKEKQHFFEDREDVKTNPYLFREVEKKERKIKNGKVVGETTYLEIVRIDHPVDRNSTEIRNDELMSSELVEFHVNRIRREKDAVRRKIADAKTEWASAIKDLNEVNARLQAL